MSARSSWFLALVVQLLFFSLNLSAAAPTGQFLVLPFENGGEDANLEWVGESFAETLSEGMVRSGYRVLTREERLAALERLGLSPGSPLSRASLIRVGLDLGVDAILFGHYRVNANQLEATAQLLNPQEPSLSAPVELQGAFPELLRLQGTLAWNVLRTLDPAFPLSRQEFLERLPSVPLSAFESYLRGLLAMTRGQQERYFQQAAHLAPTYGRPAFRLGQLYWEDRNYSAAARWFDRVPAGEPPGLEARFHSALCRFYTRDYRRAIEILEDVANRLPVKEVWNNLGVVASRALRSNLPVLADVGQSAPDYFARALEEDPADPDVHFNLGLHYFCLERWAEAEEALARAAELSPDDLEAHFLRSQALEKLGRVEEAAREREQAVGDNPALALSLERRKLELDRLHQMIRTAGTRTVGSRGEA